MYCDARYLLPGYKDQTVPLYLMANLSLSVQETHHYGRFLSSRRKLLLEVITETESPIYFGRTSYLLCNLLRPLCGQTGYINIWPSCPELVYTRTGILILWKYWVRWWEVCIFLSPTESRARFSMEPGWPTFDIFTSCVLCASCQSPARRRSMYLA
jgi:hypothetical protein